MHWEFNWNLKEFLQIEAYVFLDLSEISHVSFLITDSGYIFISYNSIHFSIYFFF